MKIIRYILSIQVLVLSPVIHRLILSVHRCLLLILSGMVCLIVAITLLPNTFT